MQNIVKAARRLLGLVGDHVENAVDAGRHKKKGRFREKGNECATIVDKRCYSLSPSHEADPFLM